MENIFSRLIMKNIFGAKLTKVKVRTVALIINARLLKQLFNIWIYLHVFGQYLDECSASVVSAGHNEKICVAELTEN